MANNDKWTISINVSDPQGKSIFATQEHFDEVNVAESVYEIAKRTLTDPSALEFAQYMGGIVRGAKNGSLDRLRGGKRNRYHRKEKTTRH